MIDNRNFVVSNVDIVTDSQVITDGSVAVRDGIIVEVNETECHGAGVIDGRGATLIPGLIDTHSDAFEKEIRPRPGVELPIDFALGSFEGRARAAGITTIFHGVAFEESDRDDRSIEQALTMCSLVDNWHLCGSATIDHRVLHRLDVRDPAGLSALTHRLDRWAETDDQLPLVSFEDHTPGQGQYADRTWFEQWVSGTRNVGLADARDIVDNIIEHREAFAQHRSTALEALSRRALGGDILLMMHDPTDENEVIHAHNVGMAIAEFPTSALAAVTARELGMRTVSGGPNAMRGTSHSGNVSARELISEGLCDGLASDYLPSTLLGAVHALVGDGVCDIVEAIKLVTAGPAGTVGLADRGRITPGCRADLVLVTFDHAMPTVRWVVSQNDLGPKDMQ